MSVKSFVIPSVAHPMVRKFYDDVSALSQESNALAEQYCRELEALQEKYIRPSADIRERMNVLRRKGSVEMCAACGIRYNEDQSYAVDTNYLKDCGVAYLQMYDADVVAADPGSLAIERAPAGTRLN